MKEALLSLGYSKNEISSLKAMIKVAHSAGLIDSEEKWLDMLEKKNNVMNCYSNEAAYNIACYCKVKYIDLFDSLEKNIKKAVI